jgi:hypothetical protein
LDHMIAALLHALDMASAMACEILWSACILPVQHRLAGPGLLRPEGRRRSVPGSLEFATRSGEAASAQARVDRAIEAHDQAGPTARSPLRVKI